MSVTDDGFSSHGLAQWKETDAVLEYPVVEVHCTDSRNNQISWTK